jgi:adenosine kinase
MTQAIFGMGNPLLDISANVDATWLEKYGLAANNACLAEEKHLPLYEELTNVAGVQYIPGGATLNSIRVARWMLGGAKGDAKLGYTGCIGKDRFGDILKAETEKEGVSMPMLRVEGTPTGTCGCLITGVSRSLVANLAAANKFEESHLDAPEVQQALQAATIFYSAGFFLTVSPSSILRVAKASQEKGGTYCLNLSAPFIIEFFAEPLKQVLPFVDIIFANESEAGKFAEVNGFGTTDMQEIAKKLQALPKENTGKPRIAVVTQGPDSTIVATSEGVTVYPVAKLEQSKIVDTNAAGDAFVGGFLALLAQGATQEKCVQAGHYAAREIIQQSGCTFPEGGPQFA